MQQSKTAQLEQSIRNFEQWQAEADAERGNAVYASYRKLVDKKYLEGLSASETAKLETLGNLIDATNETFYSAIIERVGQYNSSL